MSSVHNQKKTWITERSRGENPNFETAFPPRPLPRLGSTILEYRRKGLQIPYTLINNGVSKLSLIHKDVFVTPSPRLEYLKHTCFLPLAYYDVKTRGSGASARSKSLGNRLPQDAGQDSTCRCLNFDDFTSLLPRIMIPQGQSPLSPRSYSFIFSIYSSLSTWR